jgi:hypothetical protein
MFGHDEQQTNTDNGTPVLPTNSPMPAEPVFDEKQDNPANNGGNDAGAPVHTDATVASDDLLDIKQDALKQLSPLISHLDQSPEEKFRTTMMMIQASDDQSLIKNAYEAAQNIGDEKARAQALLDIINEINYFTQHSS